VNNGVSKNCHKVFAHWEPSKSPVPVEVLHNGYLMDTYAPVGLSVEASVAKVFDDRVIAYAAVGALVPGVWTARARVNTKVLKRLIVPERDAVPVRSRRRGSVQNYAPKS
jgi:hypothetical protein